MHQSEFPQTGIMGWPRQRQEVYLRIHNIRNFQIEAHLRPPTTLVLSAALELHNLLLLLARCSGQVKSTRRRRKPCLARRRARILLTRLRAQLTPRLSLVQERKGAPPRVQLVLVLTGAQVRGQACITREVVPLVLHEPRPRIRRMVKHSTGPNRNQRIQ